MEIYVIVGATGEYSDRMEWTVCAYRDEQLAKDHVVAATAYADAEHARVGTYNGDEARPSPYDPQMRIDYTGTSYYYSRVPVRDRLPEEVPATSG